MTLTNKKVHLIGTYVTTGSGFSQSKAVPVIFTRDVRVPDAFNDYSSSECHLKYISCPLEGGIDAPSEVNEMKAKHIDNYMTMILCYPENEVIVNKIDIFIRDVYIASKMNLLKNINPSLSQQICDQCEGAMKHILYSHSFFFSSHRGHKYIAPVMQTLESYMMNNLYPVVFKLLKEDNSEESQILENGINLMKDHPMTYFNIKQQFICDVSEAIAKLKKISKCRTPLEKAQCLKDTCDIVNECLTDHLRENNIPIESVELTTDDIIDFLIYIICKAYPNTKYLNVDLCYINQYHLANIDATSLGYTLANYDVAIKWLKQSQSHFMYIFNYF